MTRVQTGKNRGMRGHAVIEVSLMMPWIFVLVAGAFDAGYYANALIATTNAARAAALYTSSNPGAATDAAGACTYALGELNTLPNVKTLTACDVAPLVVTATQVNGPDGLPASEVRIVYRTPVLVPIPGLPRQLTITRVAQMKL